MSRIAVVTGANKGIGYAIVKDLCREFDGVVYLTSRNEERGQAAVNKLKKDGFNPKFHQLDITDDSSVERFREYLKETHGGLDVLVNNGGISFMFDAPETFPQRVAETLRVNYFGLLRICKALFPLLRPHSRVVQVSSSVGHLCKIQGAELKARLASRELTEEELTQMMRNFVDAAAMNTHREAGWPNSSYTVSKVGVSALSRIQQRAFDKDPREDIVVNAVHPGSVITDMSGKLGTMTPERGAQAPLYLALLPKYTEIKGEYVWHDNTVMDWVNGEVKTFRPDSPNLY
ncbi:carbonyl reductase [NADPH] 1-like [Neodiprion pinetum]|uniref:carbonyl reductase [NADPH] 1-like n=1 Tax=Neodiprion pinetum TaxID=441929 RepID=UPI001EDCD818|nr:carbonyl reductase [NADPH] 1-like [Neodiprion pinetum]